MGFNQESAQAIIKDEDKILNIMSDFIYDKITNKKAEICRSYLVKKKVKVNISAKEDIVQYFSQKKVGNYTERVRSFIYSGLEGNDFYDILRDSNRNPIHKAVQKFLDEEIKTIKYDLQVTITRIKTDSPCFNVRELWDGSLCLTLQARKAKKIIDVSMVDWENTKKPINWIVKQKT